MVRSGVLTQFWQIGQEIKLEFRKTAGVSRFVACGRRAQPDLLPEQRLDDEETIRHRGAEAFLRAVQCGAIHR